ncbi:hypothetical protein NDU88_000971 [Pleurodeles waltl]|uniref:Peptidase A2 domain-containing protein n=1 Tax=Pleurodeles waltl TaxID=8319 RepID=A0AAV7U6K5_PLEWA|nr:hypothetical protein NDU88_000971 [Pleurodeles waltl]
MPLWGRKKSGAESERQHGAEARSIPGWLATDPFSGVAGLLNQWAEPALWEALDEKMTPLLMEDAVESVKLRGPKLELKAAGQVRALVRKENWDPYAWDGTVSDNDDDWDWEDELEVRVAELGEVESEKESVLEDRTLVQNKSKGVNSGQIQNSRLVKDYTQRELLEITRMFRQMPAEPLFKWLVTLWDTGADGTFVSPTELLKMGSVTTHAMLRQRLQGAQGQQDFSLMGWLMEGVKQLYPTATDVDESWGPGHTLSEANEQLREIGMQNAVYSQEFAGPDVEPVTAGIRARLIRNAPPHMKGALLALLGPAQGRPVGDVVL